MIDYDFYVPIDIKCPVKVDSRINMLYGTNNSPTILFQIFKDKEPVSLGDSATVDIAFTNTNQQSVKGTGELTIVNPHRGTISYTVSKDDITMGGIHTISLGLNINNSYTILQTVLSASATNNPLATGIYNNGNYKCTGNCATCKRKCCEFPCKEYNNRCRLCRRCKFAYFHNTMPKPVSFEDIKVCDKPVKRSPLPNYDNIEGYEKTYIPTAINKDGYLEICIDDNHLICDVDADGKLFLADNDNNADNNESDITLPDLYLGPKLTIYHKVDKNFTKSTLII